MKSVLGLITKSPVCVSCRGDVFLDHAGVYYICLNSCGRVRRREFDNGSA